MGHKMLALNNTRKKQQAHKTCPVVGDAKPRPGLRPVDPAGGVFELPHSGHAWQSPEGQDGCRRPGHWSGETSSFLSSCQWSPQSLWRRFVCLLVCLALFGGLFRFAFFCLFRFCRNRQAPWKSYVLNSGVIEKTMRFAKCNAIMSKIACPRILYYFFPSTLARGGGYIFALLDVSTIWFVEVLVHGLNGRSWWADLQARTPGVAWQNTSWNPAVFLHFRKSKQVCRIRDLDQYGIWSEFNIVRLWRLTGGYLKQVLELLACRPGGRHVLCYFQAQTFEGPELIMASMRGGNPRQTSPV